MADEAVALNPEIQVEKEILNQEILVRDRFQCAILPVREKHRSVATALIVVGRRCCLEKPSSDSKSQEPVPETLVHMSAFLSLEKQSGDLL